ncbi:MAG: hypothetical protein QXW55_01375 [Candidatus Bathyarchaeia archaeon]
MSMEKPNYRSITINLLIGGVISFGAMIFLDIILNSTANWIFRSLGIYGILVYEEALNAYYLIRLGTVFLSSGFIGGLYVGHKIKENLRVIMSFPSFIGLSFMFTLQFFAGNRALILQQFSQLFGLVRVIIAPLLMLLLGSYLGGYTLNWQMEEKPKEEKISFLEFTP